MLVLSRFHNERVILNIGTEAEPVELIVTVVDIRSDKVRLGFDAPKDVAIHREEVWRAIERQRIERERERQQQVENGGHGQ